MLLLKLKSVYVNILSPIPVSYADAYTEESFQNIVLLFERSNQPDNSSTYSVGLEWGYLMSQRVAERGSIWGIKNSIFAIPFEMTHFSFK